MKKSKLMIWSIVNSLATFFYILGIAWFLFSAEKVFGKEPSFWAPAAMLLLFIISALITSALVLGRPIYLYLNNAKKEAQILFLYTVACLILLTVIAFFFLV